MTGYRRLPIVAMAALMLAGCGSTAATSSTPSTSPSATDAISTSSPRPTYAFPTPEPTIDPGSCEGLGAVITPDYEPRWASISFFRRSPYPTSVGLSPIRVVDRANPDIVWTGEPGEPQPNEPGLLPGGADVTAALRMPNYGRQELPVEILSANATVRLEDGAVREPRTRVTTNAYGQPRIVMHVPDVDGDGILEIRAEWQDRCLRYEGTGTARVSILPSEVMATCPAPGTAFAGYSETIRDPVTVDSVPVRLFLTHLLSKFSSEFVAADGPALPSWDPDGPAVRAGAGTKALLAVGNESLTLEDVGASFYRRRDVVAEWETADRVAHGSLAPTGEGRFALLVPDRAGRYVVVLSFGWDSPCAFGSGFAVLSLDVE